MYQKITDPLRDSLKKAMKDRIVHLVANKTLIRDAGFDEKDFFKDLNKILTHLETKDFPTLTFLAEISRQFLRLTAPFHPGQTLNKRKTPNVDGLVERFTTGYDEVYQLRTYKNIKDQMSVNSVQNAQNIFLERMVPEDYPTDQQEEQSENEVDSMDADIKNRIGDGSVISN